MLLNALRYHVTVLLCYYSHILILMSSVCSQHWSPQWPRERQEGKLRIREADPQAQVQRDRGHRGGGQREESSRGEHQQAARDLHGDQ